MRFRPKLVQVGDKSTPVFKTSKKIRRAAKMHYQNFADLESTQYAESMDRRFGHNYQIRPIYHQGLSFSRQNKMINGAFDKVGKYHSREYGEMMVDVKSLRTEYEKTGTLEGRKQIAGEEFQRWLKYLEIRKAALKEPEMAKENWIPDKTYHVLKEAFERERHRETNRVKSNKIVEMHGHIPAVIKFKIPLHPRNLSQIVHPHQGYMAAFPNRGFSWDELYGLYETMMVASYEKRMGRYLHAEELAALGYYMLQDEKKGYLEWTEECDKREDVGMRQLMHGLRFHEQVDHQTFTSYFSNMLRPSEFLGPRKGNPIYRWDLTRRIWLERGL